MRILMWSMIVLILTAAGCGGQEQSVRRVENRSTSSPPEQKPEVVASKVPPDVIYSIINSDIMPGVKRSLDVRLNKKVSTTVLRAIALELKSQDPRDYERTLVVYYLPEMDVRGGAWATTHFNPDLKAEILGFTREEEMTFSEELPPSANRIIGRWLDDTPHTGSHITIFEKEHRLFIELKYQDGSIGESELRKKLSPLGRRFDSVEGSATRDHWVIDFQGDLLIRDNDGLVAKAKKID